MYTFPVSLFLLLILPKGVTNAPEGCSRCFYEANCFCSGEHTRLNPSMEDCNEISCLNSQMKTMINYCKDTQGQCLTRGVIAFGSYDSRCRTLYCKVPPSEGKQVAQYDQTCMVDRKFENEKYVVYSNRFEC
ncbi:uncharacterized protein LOC128248167 isoform X2 [Octopus bimaculoides]|uniref:uncharacterized protein LOC128248167 isoform X2 n=1 Tax=Octopus bimaculoides TaxID=37653 RepID=UPI0022DFA44E|nr:uncharacterized protein LOC128248167 isoform X2 [Octopus bimaculoides]